MSATHTQLLLDPLLSTNFTEAHKIVNEPTQECKQRDKEMQRRGERDVLFLPCLSAEVTFRT